MSASLNVSKRVRIATFTQHVVQASTSVSKLLNITDNLPEKDGLEKIILAAFGVIDNFTQWPFYILVSDFKHLPTRPINKQRSQ